MQAAGGESHNSRCSTQAKLGPRGPVARDERRMGGGKMGWVWGREAETWGGEGRGGEGRGGGSALAHALHHCPLTGGARGACSITLVWSQTNTVKIFLPGKSRAQQRPALSDAHFSPAHYNEVRVADTQVHPGHPHHNPPFPRKAKTAPAPIPQPATTRRQPKQEPPPFTVGTGVPNRGMVVDGGARNGRCRRRTRPQPQSSDAWRCTRQRKRAPGRS